MKQIWFKISKPNPLFNCLEKIVLLFVCDDFERKTVIVNDIKSRVRQR